MDGAERGQGRGGEGRQASGENKLDLATGQEGVGSRDRPGRLAPGEAHGPEDRRVGTRPGQTAGSGNQAVCRPQVPGRPGRGKGAS